jgi:hypothetical protein
MRKLTLTLSEQEVELIFKALGQRPFQEVYEVIGNINEQVNAQYDAEDQTEEPEENEQEED